MHGSLQKKKHMINNRFLFFQTGRQFEAQKDKILYDSIVFVKNPPFIWTHGVYYEGGGGGGGEQSTIDIYDTPIYYSRFIDKNTPIPTIGNYDNSIVELIGSHQVGTDSIQLNDSFLYLAVPNNITLTKAETSNREPLSLTDNFVVYENEIPGYKVWKYMPVIAPEDLTITFTFRVS